MIILDNGQDEKPRGERVPEFPPFGSITDGEWVCGRCRESRTGCALCAGEVRHVVRYKPEWAKDYHP